MTTPFKVRSRNRKTGTFVKLDPNFLNRAAAETFKTRLEAKFGSWYAYDVVNASEQADAEAWEALGAAQPPDVALDDQGEDSVRYVPTAAQQAQWDAEKRELDRKMAAHWAGRNLDEAAKPDDGYDIAEDGGCLRCARTGLFITGSVNGVPTGPGGKCFRCEGKGRQTVRDAKRNDYWERHRTISL